MHTPDQIASLLLWWDASREDLMTKDGSGLVSAVTPRAGSQPTLTLSAAGSARPTWSATARNSKPGWTGDGVDDVFTIDNGATLLPVGTTPSQFFAIAFCGASTGTSWRGLFTSGSTTVSRSPARDNLGNAAWGGFSAGNDTKTTISWVNADHIYVGDFASDGIRIWIDGPASTSAFKALTNPSTANSANPRFMGSSAAGDRWPGVVHDAFYYTANLSTADRQKNEGYLAHKWGYTSLLASDHPYKTDAPMVGLSGSIALGDIVGVSAIEASNPVTMDVVLGEIVGESVIQEVFNLDGDVVLGEIVGLSEITSAMILEGEAILGELVVEGVSDASTNIESEAILGEIVGEGVFQEVSDLEAEAILGEIIGESELTAAAPNEAFVIAILDEIVGEGIMEIYEVVGEGILGEIVCTAVITQIPTSILIVEDGSVVANANSYITQQYAEDYLESLGYLDFLEDTNLQKQGAIIRATEAIDVLYGERYPGTPVAGRSQSLLWPRKNAKDVEGEIILETEVPIEIRKATAEAAYLEWLTPGYLTPNWTPDQMVTSEKLGPLSVTYSDPSKFGRGGNMPTLSKIDGILSSLLSVKPNALFGMSVRI
jgi:hypothetical protein